MAIPEQVKQAGIEADNALAELANPTQPAAPTAPAPEPAPAPSVAPTTPTAELARLQQELLTSNGRNNAQDREMAELRGRLDALTQVAAARPAPAAPAAPAPVNLITDEDRSDFGEDMIDFVRRVMQQAYGATIQSLLNRIQKLEGTVTQVATKAERAQASAEETAFDRYLRKLDSIAAGWRATNDDPAFVDWLSKPDTFSRKPLHDLLADAHNKADAEGVAAFFQAYWKEKGTTPAAPAAVQPPAPTAPAAAAAPTIDPQSLVAPTPSSAPSPSSNPRGGKIWSQAEIEKVFDDRIRGRITPDVFAQMEAEINTAIMEGRVQ